MLVIRFLRTGKKNQPFFRIVVTDKRNPPRAGRFLEILGFFNPLTKRKNLKKERIKYWLSVGAKSSARVHNLLIDGKIIEAKKINVYKKKKDSVGESKPSATFYKKVVLDKPVEVKPVESKSASTEGEDGKSVSTEVLIVDAPAVKKDTIKKEKSKESKKDEKETPK